MAISQTPVEQITQALNAAHSALALHEKFVDKVVPWKTYEETIEKLTEYQSDYSIKAGKLVGQVHTDLMQCKQRYLKSIWVITSWCEKTVRLLPRFVELDSSIGQEVWRKKQAIILKVLEDGVQLMTEALLVLGDSQDELAEASGDLIALRSELDADFQENSSYFQKQVNKMRAEAYGGAAVGVVYFLWIGLVISYSIAAGVVEGKMIPDLKKKMEQVKATFKALQETVEKTQEGVKEIYDQIGQEIGKITMLKTDADLTYFWIELATGQDDADVKDAANKLLKKCNAYITRHKPRH